MMLNKSEKTDRSLLGPLKTYKNFVIVYCGFGIVTVFFMVTISLHPIDVYYYWCYANAFWHGVDFVLRNPDVYTQCGVLAPYIGTPMFQMLPREYPFLSLVLFSFLLFSPSAMYEITFAVFMGLFILAVYVALSKTREKKAANVFILYIIFGGLGTTLARYDLIPAIFTLICLIMAERKKFFFAYIFLAVAVWLKLYPILLFLPLLIFEQQTLGYKSLLLKKSKSYATGLRSWLFMRFALGVKNFYLLYVLGLFARGRGALLFLAVNLLFFCISYSVNPGITVNIFRYFLDRPIEIESFPATIFWIFSMFGAPIDVKHVFDSQNVFYNPDFLHTSSTVIFDKIIPVIMPISSTFFIIGYLTCLFLLWRKKLALGESFVAIILITLLTSKVLSPQYLLWVIPLLSYVAKYEKGVVFFWIIISLLTTIIYPFLFYSFLSPIFYQTIFLIFVVAAIRNILLLLFTISFIKDSVKKSGA